MSSNELDHLLERMPAIAKAVESFSSETLQAQAFQALIEAFQSDSSPGGGSRRRAPVVEPEPAGITDEQVPLAEDEQKPNPAKRASARKSSGGSKAKQSFSIDKQLDLLKGGSPSFPDFVAEKAPSNVLEKVLVAVYWLTRVRSSDEPATLERVYTCFKHMEWPIPADLANTAQQAGARGWLDSKKRDDLKVVISGENWIEHSMPAPPKKKS